MTDGSFDAYVWQALETKARFIAQVMSGDCAVGKAEDIGGQELSDAEVKAIASGNPAVLTLADAEPQRLAIPRKNPGPSRDDRRGAVRLWVYPRMGQDPGGHRGQAGPVA